MGNKKQCAATNFLHRNKQASLFPSLHLSVFGYASTGPGHVPLRARCHAFFHWFPPFFLFSPSYFCQAASMWLSLSLASSHLSSLCLFLAQLLCLNTQQMLPRRGSPPSIPGPCINPPPPRDISTTTILSYFPATSPSFVFTSTSSFLFSTHLCFPFCLLVPFLIQPASFPALPSSVHREWREVFLIVLLLRPPGRGGSEYCECLPIHCTVIPSVYCTVHACSIQDDSSLYLFKYTGIYLWISSWLMLPCQLAEEWRIREEEGRGIC